MGRGLGAEYEYPLGPAKGSRKHKQRQANRAERSNSTFSKVIGEQKALDSGGGTPQWGKKTVKRKGVTGDFPRFIVDQGRET